MVGSVMAGMTGLLALFLLKPEAKKLNVPPLLSLSVGIVLFWGWYMTVNARADHSMQTWIFAKAESRILDYDWAPGSIALSSSLQEIAEASLTFLALFGVLRATQAGHWKLILKTIASLGALVALCGFIHKAFNAETVWWIEDESSRASYFFAPFYYHANAGAFLNLCLPVAIGLSLSEMGKGKRYHQSVFWAILAMFMLSAVIATASKGAIAMLLVMIPLIIFLNRKHIFALVKGLFLEKRRRRERLAFIIVLWLTGIVLLALGIETTVDRTQSYFTSNLNNNRESLNGRIPMMQLMARMGSPGEGSWHGFGPGSFAHLVPYFTASYEEGSTPVAAGRWVRGHCDPLETIVEWGYVGASGWFMIGLGSVVCGMLLLRSSRFRGKDRPLIIGVVISLVIVGLHACFDFPLSIYSLHLVALILGGICWALWGQTRLVLRAEKAEGMKDAADKNGNALTETG